MSALRLYNPWPSWPRIDPLLESLVYMSWEPEWPRANQLPLQEQECQPSSMCLTLNITDGAFKAKPIQHILDRRNNMKMKDWSRSLGKKLSHVGVPPNQGHKIHKEEMKVKENIVRGLAHSGWWCVCVWKRWGKGTAAHYQTACPLILDEVFWVGGVSEREGGYHLRRTDKCFTSLLDIQHSLACYHPPLRYWYFFFFLLYSLFHFLIAFYLDFIWIYLLLKILWFWMVTFLEFGPSAKLEKGDIVAFLLLVTNLWIWPFALSSRFTFFNMQHFFFPALIVLLKKC